VFEPTAILVLMAHHAAISVFEAKAFFFFLSIQKSPF
jgi:hypothetical protein